jgi:hypothetical protein
MRLGSEQAWSPLSRALLLVANGRLLVVSLGALLGIWFGRTGGG